MLTTSYDALGPNRFDIGQFQSTTADDSHGLGWAADGASQVKVAYTFYGDATMDGSVDSNDLTKVLANYNQGPIVPGITAVGVLDAQAIQMLTATGFTVVPQSDTPALLAGQTAEEPSAASVCVAPDVATSQPDANFGAALAEPASIGSDTNKLSILTTEQFHTVPKRAAALQAARDAVFGSGIVDKLFGAGGNSDSEADAVIGRRCFTGVRRNIRAAAKRLGMTGSGTVIASVAVGIAHDAAGNPNEPSQQAPTTK